MTILDPNFPHREDVERALVFLDTFGEWRDDEHPPFAAWKRRDIDHWYVTSMRHLIDKGLSEAHGTERTPTALILANLLAGNHGPQHLNWKDINND